ncbi:CAP domain-containing protein [Streptomyces sp. UNOB3_S3]|uniref:CAP domain-containing protein n=1 Tax=Streptomyces sp. UNOB3_S3 TaxID=2871682 RepID=UPI001E6116D5|nr:CAP domain-containing protein [Streptomyces sp. UNOB3_S3]
MRPRPTSLVLTTAAVLVVGLSRAAPAGADTTASLRQQITTLVNAHRHAAGCAPLRISPQLTAAAQKHSDDMAERHFFGHTDPGGADPGARISAAGYRWDAYGENIARGQATPAAVMDAWMRSAGHRENILDCSFKEMGVGIATAPEGPFWTQDFGSRE